MAIEKFTGNVRTNREVWGELREILIEKHPEIVTERIDSILQSLYPSINPILDAVGLAMNKFEVKLDIDPEEDITHGILQFKKKYDEHILDKMGVGIVRSVIEVSKST